MTSRMLGRVFPVRVMAGPPGGTVRLSQVEAVPPIGQVPAAADRVRNGDIVYDRSIVHQDGVADGKTQAGDFPEAGGAGAGRDGSDVACGGAAAAAGRSPLSHPAADEQPAASIEELCPARHGYGLPAAR